MGKRKKPVMLPTWFKEVAEEVIIHDPALKNLKKGSKKYKDTKAALLQRFADEAYREALTPGVTVASNPYTPRIPKDLYEEFPKLIGPEGVFSDSVERRLIPASEKRDLVLRFRSSITHLAQIFCESRLGLETDKDFDFPPDASEKKQKEVIVNRLFRVYVFIALMKSVEPFYTLDPDLLIRFLKTMGVSTEAELAQLTDKTLRKRYIRMVKQDFETVFASVDIEGFIEKQLRALPGAQE